MCVSGPLTICRVVGWWSPSHASQHKALLPTPSQDTLTEISEWLEGHPREVVVLACRNFEGMTEGLHEYLVGCIKNIFGDKLCPRGVSRGRGLPVLSAAGAVGAPGFTVIRLSTRCMRLIQAPGDGAQGTPVIHPPLSALKHASNQPITGHRHPQ